MDTATILNENVLFEKSTGTVLFSPAQVPRGQKKTKKTQSGPQPPCICKKFVKRTRVKCMSGSLALVNVV